MKDSIASIWPRLIFLLFILSLSALNCGELGGTETGNPTNPTNSEEDDSGDEMTTDDTDNDLDDNADLLDISPNVRVTLDPETLACYEALQASFDAQYIMTGIIFVGFEAELSESQVQEIAFSYGLEVNEYFDSFLAASFTVEEGTEMAWVCLLDAEDDLDAYPAYLLE